MLDKTNNNNEYLFHMKKKKNIKNCKKRKRKIKLIVILSQTGSKTVNLFLRARGQFFCRGGTIYEYTAALCVQS